RFSSRSLTTASIVRMSVSPFRVPTTYECKPGASPCAVRLLAPTRLSAGASVSLSSAIGARYHLPCQGIRRSEAPSFDYRSRAQADCGRLCVGPDYRGPSLPMSKNRARPPAPAQQNFETRRSELTSLPLDQRFERIFRTNLWGADDSRS